MIKNYLKYIKEQASHVLDPYNEDDWDEFNEGDLVIVTDKIKEYIYCDHPKISKRCLHLIGKEFYVNLIIIYIGGLACVIEDKNDMYAIPADCLKKIENKFEK